MIAHPMAYERGIPGVSPIEGPLVVFLAFAIVALVFAFVTGDWD